LRADFAVCETYRYLAGEPLQCPISAFGGDADAEVNSENLKLWRVQTSASFRARVFDGGHFFLLDHWVELAAEIAACVQTSLDRRGIAGGGVRRTAL
jgi:surfactin synthase thioesterase subunit